MPAHARAEVGRLANLRAKPQDFQEGAQEALDAILEEDVDDEEGPDAPQGVGGQRGTGKLE